MAVLAVTSELDVFLALVVMGLRTDAFLLSRAKSRCGARSSALRGELLQSSPRRASAISLNMLFAESNERYASSRSGDVSDARVWEVPVR